MTKHLKYLIIGVFFALIIACFSACNPLSEKPVIESLEKPQIITAPVASNIIVGQSISESVLSGEFSVSGSLRFTGAEFVLQNQGSVEREWEFVPNDLTKYNKLTGTVIVNVYRYKLTYEENGGFEIEDIFFNDSYSLVKKPLTAKNEYRFDGWSYSDDSTEYISYPITFSQSLTLYACYRFHTAEKLCYLKYDRGLNENNQLVYRMYVRADYSGEIAAGNTRNPRPDVEDPPLEGSIEGEIIIADMYDGMFVEEIGGFSHTRISNIVFNNYIVEIGSKGFIQCPNLTEVTIPNTINKMDLSFGFCSGIERVIFEPGKGYIDTLGDFSFCYNLKEVTINRLKNITSSLFAITALESITIPEEVEEIHTASFGDCENLREVIILGNNLREVSSMAFAECSSLTEITFPPVTHISPAAFKRTPIQNINITDEQINWIAKELHENYIGSADDFTVNIERNTQYGGMKFEGEYSPNTETINLRFENFSINVLDALIHEFFHHYQYVLMEGVGAENRNTVIVLNAEYHIVGVPIFIVKNDIIFDENTLSVGGFIFGSYNKGDYAYEVYLERYEECNHILIDDSIIDPWREEYISLLPDESNWEEYWNQPFEKDARDFSSGFTGVEYVING